MLGKWKSWFKGALFGLIVGLLISIGITRNIGILSSLAMLGVFSCRMLTQCPECLGCNILGLIFNLIYGFIIGGFVGWLINNLKSKKKRNGK